MNKKMMKGTLLVIAVVGMLGVGLAGPLPTDANRLASDTVSLTSNVVYRVEFTGARVVSVINNSADEIRIGFNHGSTNTFVTALSNTGAVKVVAYGVYSLAEATPWCWSLSMIGPTSSVGSATYAAQ